MGSHVLPLVDAYRRGPQLRRGWGPQRSQVGSAGRRVIDLDAAQARDLPSSSDLPTVCGPEMTSTASSVRSPSIRPAARRLTKGIAVSRTDARIVASPELYGVFVSRYPEFSSDHRWSFWRSHPGVSLANSNRPAARVTSGRWRPARCKPSRAVRRATRPTRSAPGASNPSLSLTAHEDRRFFEKEGVDLVAVSPLRGQPANPPATLVRPTVGRDVVGFPVGFHQVDPCFTDHRNTRYAGLLGGGEGTRPSNLLTAR